MDSVEQAPPAGVSVAGAGSMRLLLDDMPYAALLALALAGVVLRLPVSYWVILTPVFGLISIAEGWRHFTNRSERLDLVCRLALDWFAVLLAIYLLFNSGVQGVMNANATSLAMMTLLALGTFVAGVQARVWQICLVGGLLFAAVPGIGWLDQSPLLLAFGGLVIMLLAGAAWWMLRRPVIIPCQIPPRRRHGETASGQQQEMTATPSRSVSAGRGGGKARPEIDDHVDKGGG